MNSRRNRRLDGVVWTTSLGFLCLLLSARGHAAAPADANAAAWREECSSCHLAYPAQLLPAAEWRTLMGSLNKHFGVDASLDPARSAAIGAYLQSHAGRSERGPAPAGIPRITTQAWFVREHDEVPASVWRRPAVHSRANCGACHTGAEQGVFDEDSVRVPK